MSLPRGKNNGRPVAILGLLGLESNSRLLWFYCTLLCDWLAKLASYSQAGENKSQLARTRLLAHVFASSSDWFIALFWSAVIGRSNYFSFGFTTLN